MLINNKNKFLLSGFAALSLMVAGCSEDTTEVHIADLYQKAYLSTGTGSSSEYTYQGTYAAANVQLNGTRLEYGPTISTSHNVDYTFDVFLRTTYDVKQTISGTVSVAADPQQCVDAYNKSKGANYSLMPEDCYRIVNDRVTIEAGEREASVQVELNPDVSWDAGQYLLPIGCTLDEGTEVELSETADVVYLKVDMSQDKTFELECMMLSPDQYEISTTGETAQYAFDEDNTTWWSTSSTDETVDVTFDEPIYLMNICFVDLCRRVYVYLRYEGETDFVQQEGYIGNNNNTVQPLYVYDPTTNSGAPMDPYRRVAGVRFKFQARQNANRIGDIYFIARDLANMTPKGFIMFDKGAEASYVLSKAWSVELVDHVPQLVDVSETPESSVFELPMRSFSPVTSQMNGTLSVPADAEQAVEAYNQANGTVYELLPSDYYEISASASIDAGATSSSEPFRVSLNETGLADLTKTTRYLLPLTLSVEGGALDEDRSTVYIKVDITHGPKYRVLTPEEYTVAGGDGDFENAFDQNYDTYWDCYDYDSTVTVTFNEATALEQVMLLDVDYYAYVSLQPNGGSFGSATLLGNGAYAALTTFTNPNPGTPVSAVKIRNYYNAYIADIYFVVPDEE